MTVDEIQDLQDTMYSWVRLFAISMLLHRTCSWDILVQVSLMTLASQSCIAVLGTVLGTCPACQD